MSAYALLVGICHVVLGCVIAWRLAGRVAYRRGFVDGYRYVPEVLDDTMSQVFRAAQERAMDEVLHHPSLDLHNRNGAV